MCTSQEETSHKTIMVLGEGLTDVGRRQGEPLPEKTQGVVCILVKRLCGSPGELKVQGIPFPELEVPGKDRKIQFFLKQNIQIGNAAGGVLFFDSDGGQKETKQKQDQLEQFRDKFAEKCSKPVAVGIAQPMIEAWLLTDSNILEEINGEELSAELPDNPESISNVKHALATLLKDRSKASSAKIKWKIARKCDLATLREKCPIGFVPFENEVEKLLKPLLNN